MPDQITREASIADQYYNRAVQQVDDLTPFIELVNEIDQLSKEGRINDMRRLLVVRTVEYTAERERLEQKAVDAMLKFIRNPNPERARDRHYKMPQYLDEDSFIRLADEALEYRITNTKKEVRYE